MYHSTGVVQSKTSIVCLFPGQPVTLTRRLTQRGSDKAGSYVRSSYPALIDPSIDRSAGRKTTSAI